MAELTNDFTWSVSRDSTFRYCKRQYWWNYYGSWGGWELNAEPETRHAYVLKNLHNRWAWVGTVVHEAIEEMLRQIHRRGQEIGLGFEDEPFDAETEAERLTQRMRDDWVESRSEAYRLRPKRRFGLAEHEYQEDVPREEWKQMNAKAKAAIRSFLTSDLFRELEQSDTKLWLPIEQLDQFQFEGTPVWAVLDFARKTPEGGIEIYDWKTGMPDPKGNKPQLAAYTLYVKDKYGVEPDAVRTALVYLGDTMSIVPFTMSEQDLKEARAFMRESIALMRARLKDPKANVAVREDFPLTDDLVKCQTCVYRALCGRA